MTLSIILPNQLFQNNILINLSHNILLIEEPTFFTKFNYHKMKILLHHASMIYYYDYIRHKYKNHNIKYININDIDYDNIFNKYDQEHNIYNDNV